MKRHLLLRIWATALNDASNFMTDNKFWSNAVKLDMLDHYSKRRTSWRSANGQSLHVCSKRSCKHKKLSSRFLVLVRDLQVYTRTHPNWFGAGIGQRNSSLNLQVEGIHSGLFWHNPAIYVLWEAHYTPEFSGRFIVYGNKKNAKHKF